MALITKGAVDKLIELTTANNVTQADLSVLKNNIAMQMMNLHNEINSEVAARKALTSIMSYKASTIEVSGTECKATFTIPSGTHGIILPYGMIRYRTGAGSTYAPIELDTWYNLENAGDGITFEPGPLEVEEFYIWALIVRSQY